MNVYCTNFVNVLLSIHRESNKQFLMREMQTREGLAIDRNIVSLDILSMRAKRGTSAMLNRRYPYHRHHHCPHPCFLCQYDNWL